MASTLTFIDPVALRYESLIRLAEAIRSQLNQKELFHFVADELLKVIPFDAIAQYDGPGNKINWRLCAERGVLTPLPGPDIKKEEESIAGWMYRVQEPLVIPDVELEMRFPATVHRLNQLQIRSLCALPLTTAHRKIGSLLIASKRVDAYSEEEVRFLALVANQIALAMDDARNFQESRDSQERLQLLLDLTNRVVANLDLRELLREVSASIRQVMHCDGAGVSLPDPETGELRLYALDFPGGKGILREGIAIKNMASSVLTAFECGQSLILTKEQIAEDGLIAAEGAQSLCRLPLTARGRVLGVLSVGSMQENIFSEEDFSFLKQVASQVAIAVENALAYGQIAALKDKLAQEKVYLEDEIRSELNFEEIVGTSEGMRRVLKQVETVAPADSTVLIYGETGTGKELIARAVHNLSTRNTNAFVKLNCAAIPMGLLESELFGHERGAFTGAIAQRIGRFELAHRGTIFLDEVGEIPLELQPKLLRVLQEHEFERLGSSRTIRTDARMIAATNRDLETMVAEGTFRSDLYYRLNVFPVVIPPLRERPEDIPLLVRHFTQQFSRRNNRSIETIPSETMEALVKYDWPGNIRELQNVIERAVIVSKGSVLRVPAPDLKPRNAIVAQALAGEDLRGALDEEERKRILSALEHSNWVVAGANGAAARLGMKRSTLQFRMQKLGIRVARTGA